MSNKNLDQNLKDLHAAVEPFRQESAQRRIDTIEGNGKSFYTFVQRLGVEFESQIKTGGIGLRAVLVSTGEKVPNVDYREVKTPITIPTSISLIRNATEKEDKKFNATPITSQTDLYNYSKLTYVYAYFSDAIQFLEEHPEIAAKGVRPAIIVYDMTQLQSLDVFKYQVKLPELTERAVLKLYVGRLEGEAVD